MKALTGTGVALVTPFNNDKSIDFASLSAIVAHTSAHCDYLVVNGTTGEPATLTYEEEREVLSAVYKANTHNRPIVFGLGSNATREALNTVANVDFSLIDAVLSICPYYNKPSQEGIYQHYVTLADASPKPVVVYNVPGRTGINIEAETTIRLSAHPNIVGIKEASGRIEQIMTIIRDTPDDFILISGDDMVTPALMAMGAVGVISVLANAFPADIKAITHLCLMGDYKSATAKASALLEISNLAFAEGNPVGIKAMLNLLGLCGNVLRLPLVPASPTLFGKIKSEIERYRAI